MAERKVDVLVVRWYERRGAPDIVGRWFDAAQEHLPEAVPVRFGDYEPLRGRGGRAEVQAAWARADPLLFLTGTAPVYHASFDAGAGARLGPVMAHSMQAELDPGDERVRRFALAVTGADTFYVSASVGGGMTLDRKTLWGPAERPEEPYLAPLGDWLGLPPEPPAWCWFGPAYARKTRTEFYAGGPWVPERLRARLGEAEPSRRHAPWLPRGLRRSPWQLLIRR
ncbi:hypothetical protein [Actinoplanes sp. M2I2]|uniref:hypothetical protein n=1 Tax=Actinoplanes sp. M2I2 TaxID=1734444 RepID=UPI0020223FD3|nr:hypothetical protein [Actinoplanes sp. M2I2]